MKKDVLENFSKFIGKHQCLSLLYNKVAGGFYPMKTPENLRFSDVFRGYRGLQNHQREAPTHAFSCEFAEFSILSFLLNTSG